MNALLLFLNCFTDSVPVHYDPLISEQTKPSPYYAASVPSRLTFGYVTRLIWKGYRDGVPLATKELPSNYDLFVIFLQKWKTKSAYYNLISLKH